jgi:hypothetical protein
MKDEAEVTTDTRSQAAQEFDRWIFCHWRGETSSPKQVYRKLRSAFFAGAHAGRRIAIADLIPDVLN